MDEPTDAREPATTAPHDDWPWAYEVRRAKRLRALSNERITMPLPFALAAAAFVYPFLALPLYAIAGVIERLLAGSGVSFWGAMPYLVGYPFWAGSFGLFLGIATLLLSSLVSLAAVVISQTFRYPPDETRLAMHVGSWTALLGTAILVIPYPVMFGTTSIPMLLGLMLAGPGIAIPLAQYAAAWSQWPGEGEETPAATRGFGLLPLMITTTWIGVGLALLKWSGLLSTFLLLYLVGWNLYAWVTMGPVIRFCRWRARRISKKRTAASEG